MAVTGISAVAGLPYRPEANIITGTPVGTVNPGDWLAFSGQSVVPSYSGGTAYWKASGAGVALESSPVYDQAGRTAINTGLLIARRGMFRVSGAQSGSPTLGLGAFPFSTGSGVAAPIGATGLGATWSAVAGVTISANPTGQVASTVATIVGTFNPGQTAQLDIIFDLNHNFGYYG